MESKSTFEGLSFGTLIMAVGQMSWARARARARAARKGV